MTHQWIRYGLLCLALMLGSVAYPKSHPHAHHNTSQQPIHNPLAPINPLIIIDHGHVSLHQQHLACTRLITLLASQRHLNWLVPETTEPEHFLHVHWHNISWQTAWRQALKRCHYSPHQQKHLVVLDHQRLRHIHTFVLKHRTMMPTSPLWQAWQHHFLPPSHLVASDHPNTLTLWGTPQEAASLQALIHTLDHPPTLIAVQIHWLLMDEEGEHQLGLQNQALFDPKHWAHWPKHLSHHGLLHALAPWALQRTLQTCLAEMVQKGHAKTIAAPHLLTENGQQASFQTGLLYPYTTKNSRGSAQTTFKPVELNLQLTPYLLKDGWLELHVDSTQNQLHTNPYAHGQPMIQTHAIHTIVRMRPKQTLILGGVTTNQTNTQRTQHGLISQLPLLHWLFDANSHKHQHKKIFIWITPTLYQSNPTPETHP